MRTIATVSESWVEHFPDASKEGICRKVSWQLIHHRTAYVTRILPLFNLPAANTSVKDHSKMRKLSQVDCSLSYFEPRLK